MPAGEKVGVGSDGEDRYGVCGMRAGSPTDMRLLVEQRDACFAKRVDGLVHVFDIFGFAFTGILVEVFEVILLIGRDLHGIPEAEVLAVESLHVLPFGFGVLFEELREAVGEES